MHLLPLIRISNGECMDALEHPGQGEALPITDPREVALRFQRMGAVGLHVTDVDAATGQRPNDEAILSILDVAHVPVQVGGGVSSLRRIQELRDTGAARVVVGTFGVLHLDWMREAAKCFPSGLVANLDEKMGTVWVKGQTEDTRRPLEELAREFDACHFEAMMITSLNGTGHERLHSIAKTLRTPLWVQARVTDMGQLLAFKEAGVKGVVLGSEVYDRTIDFAEATKTFKAF